MTSTHGFEEGRDGRRTEGPVVIGDTCGVGEVVNMGDDIKGGVTGELEGDGWDGGSGWQGGEVENPEAVSGCLAASEERGGFWGGADVYGIVEESGGAVGADESGDGEEVVKEVGVGADEARDRARVVGEAEGASGGSPKDRAVGEIKGGRGDETRGEEGGQAAEGGGTEEDVGGAGIGEEGGTRDRSRKDGGGRWG